MKETISIFTLVKTIHLVRCIFLLHAIPNRINTELNEQEKRLYKPELRYNTDN